MAAALVKRKPERDAPANEVGNCWRALLGEQHVTRTLDRARDGALLFGREVRVLTRQDLAGVGLLADQHLGRGKRDLDGRQGTLRLFSRAHC